MSDNSAEIRQLAPLSMWCLTHQGLSMGAPSREGYPGLPYSIAAEFQKGAFQGVESQRESVHLLASCLLISHWLRKSHNQPESMWEVTSEGFD